MGLVEYSSSSDSESGHEGQQPQQRPCKRRRTSPSSASSPSAAVPTPPPPCPNGSPAPGTTRAQGPGTGGTLPPLPPSFHDLYASTVRTATADLPSLHHGRRRAIPHREGSWPSHIYVEWHPPPPQHALLRSLLDSLSAALDPALRGQQDAGSGGAGAGAELTGFLESGLGAPLPLHVSLSRPFALETAEKDAFLAELVRDVAGCGVGGFALVCDALAWHRSPDSGRSFLVLRVRSSRSGAAAAAKNPELSALLARCNGLVSSYGQPALYAASQAQQQQQNDPGVENEAGVGDGAFHVSIAWSFAEPTDEICRLTAEVFARPEFRDRVTSDITIPVEGVKAKIGNVVTNIPLVGRKARKRGLFGEV